MNKGNQNHWETVYKTKQPNEVSWTQELPKTSLDFIHTFNLPKSASIVDIGGGDSKFVDYLLQEGFENITVLDISSAALEKAKKRLGDKAQKVKWIVSDVTDFKPATKFDVWHDRATFHFLTTPKQVKKYIETASKSVTGFSTIGTFSENGPDKCSGLKIKKYSEKTLTTELQKGFDKLRCITEDHVTPFKQSNIFCFVVLKGILTNKKGCLKQLAYIQNLQPGSIKIYCCQNIAMRYRIKSVLLVSLQFIFIFLLLSGTPLNKLSLSSYVFVFLSILLVAWSIVAMQKSKLRIVPEPSAAAVLITNGPYRFIRHPMYTAVLLGCVGLLISHFTYLRLAMITSLATVLIIKLLWEEKMLTQMFEGYKNYMAHTNRLLPFIF